MRVEREKERKIQARLDDASSLLASGNWSAALQKFKDLEKESESVGYQAGVQTARNYILRIEREYKEKDYHGTQLVARERDVMVAVARLVGEPVPYVSKVDEETFGFVAENGYVVQLGFYRKGLAFIPETTGDLESLQVLNLKRNRLESVPKTIGQLERLIYLDLGHNKLTSIPESIGNLKSLPHLSLWGN
ncbi:MAG: leucine-rich repeat domain-containing protein, partial [Promethearchaeota archaeon]